MDTSYFIRLFKDYRVLTTAQLSLLLGLSEQMTRRHLRQLRAKNILRELPRKSIGRGRPKSAFACQGDEFKPHLLEHQLALNWCRIHFSVCPKKSTQFLAHTSTDLRLEVPTSPTNNASQTFIPDGALAITGNEKQLLFFIEMDMGTEPLRASKAGATDFLDKLDAYRVLFGSKGYKQFETRFKCAFRGFRLLIVANSQSRFEGLCQLVQSEMFCDFVWLTELDTLRNQGIQKPIWAKGGMDTALKSILAKLGK